MSEFPANPQRLDPYKNFKFRVMWDGKYVAGVSKVSALRRSTEVIAHREGADPSQQHLSPGLTSYAPIVLERGRSQDPSFEAWANKVWQLHAGAGNEVGLKDFRKDVIIDFLNEAGQLVMRFLVYRCWPSEYMALPDLDAGANAIAIESLTVQHEGWARDQSVTEPVEPT